MPFLDELKFGFTVKKESIVRLGDEAFNFFDAEDILFSDCGVACRFWIFIPVCVFTGLDEFPSISTGESLFVGTGVPPSDLFTELPSDNSLILDLDGSVVDFAKKDFTVFCFRMGLIASIDLNFMEDIAGVTACHWKKSSRLC